jgi:hypothetical protein
MAAILFFSRPGTFRTKVEKQVFPNIICIINLKLKPEAVMLLLKIMLRCTMTLVGNWPGTYGTPASMTS